MILGDHHLLLVGVGAQLDDLHPVKQRPGHGIQSIGGGDEQHIGKIIGNFQIMIPISPVLLRVQHLQQSRAGVAPVIRAHFVNFVQQKHRIAAPGLGHGVHDPAGHGSHIGLPMTPNVRLIVNAAQGNSRHFPVQRLGNGIGNRGLAHAGRPHQAKNLRRHLRGGLADGNSLQNPLLHLLHAEVILIQNPPGSVHVQPLLGSDVPGQLQHRVQIIAQNRPLGRAEGLLFQPLHVLEKLLFHVLIQFQALDFRGVAFALVFVLALAQLILNHLNLLAQIVIPLIFVHDLLGLLLNLRFQIQHLHLPVKKPQSHFQSADWVQLAQELSLVRELNAGILGNAVGDIAAAVACHHVQIHCLGRMLGHLQIQPIQVIGLPAQCLGAHGVPFLRLRHSLNGTSQVRLGLGHLGNSAPAQAGDQNPQILPLGPQHLLDLGHGTHGVQVFQLRVVHQQILLGYQK